jgi:hypothetical protein
VVAERAFRAQFVELDESFEDDLSMSGNFKIDCLALDQLQRALAQEARDDILLDLGRRGDNR